MELGVAFDWRASGEGIRKIKNIDRRVNELGSQLDDVIVANKVLTRSDALKLRERLGSADGFLRGRLGALVWLSIVDQGLVDLLTFVKDCLGHCRPKGVDTSATLEWCVFTDASFEKSSRTGGLGGVLIAPDGSCCSCFSCSLDENSCSGSRPKKYHHLGV